MPEVGRHLWRLSNPTPLVKQTHLQQIAHDPMQSGFNISKFGEKPVPVFDHPHNANGFFSYA